MWGRVVLRERVVRRGGVLRGLPGHRRALLQPHLLPASLLLQSSLLQGDLPQASLLSFCPESLCPESLCPESFRADLLSASLRLSLGAASVLRASLLGGASRLYGVIRSDGLLRGGVR
ncbi:hypothetical protein GCM10020219_057860 [Nonomuraea dietziae]